MPPPERWLTSCSSCRAHPVHHSQHVGLDHLRRPLRVELVQPAEGPDAGVVDHHVQLPAPLDRALHQLFHLRVVGHVAGHRQPVQLGRHRIEQLCPAPGHHHPRATLVQGVGDRAPDAGRRTGDDRHGTFQPGAGTSRTGQLLLAHDFLSSGAANATLSAMETPSLADRLLAPVSWLGGQVRRLLAPLFDRIGAALLRMVAPWERLPVPAQVGIAFPTLSVLLFLFHLGPLRQPLLRAIFYGVFWSILATPAIVIATQNELRKRRKR